MSCYDYHVTPNMNTTASHALAFMGLLYWKQVLFLNNCDFVFQNVIKLFQVPHAVFQGCMNGNQQINYWIKNKYSVSVMYT